MRVEVQGRVAGSPPPARVRRILTRASRAARLRAREVSVLFCADGRMRSLNRRYRGHGPADRRPVVSGRRRRPVGGFLGDIVISVPYASRSARRRATSRRRARSTGCSSTDSSTSLGYDHETDEGEMDALEARLRRRLRIAEAAPAKEMSRRARA